MITPNSLFSPMDPKSQRKRALASVYDFLLKLAEEKKNSDKSEAPEIKKEKDSVPLKSNNPSQGV